MSMLLHGLCVCVCVCVCVLRTAIAYWKIFDHSSPSICARLSWVSVLALRRHVKSQHLSVGLIASSQYSTTCAACMA